MSRHPALILLSLSLLFGGCNRDSQNNSNLNPTVPVPKRLTLQLTPITPLLPRLRTQLAIDSRGNLYWLQESDPPLPGADLVYAMGDSGVPQSIPELSTTNLVAIPGRAKAKTATGAIRAMAVGPDDQLYVYFTGGSGRATVTFLARYDPKTRHVQVVADAARLMAASGLGASMELAHAALLSSGQDLWLWLRHTDDAAILKIDPKSESVDFHRLELKPAAPDSQRSPKLQLTSEEDDLSAGAQQSLYYVDRHNAALWKINSSGEFSSVLSLETFSEMLTPAAVDSSGEIYLLAGDGPRLHGRSSLTVDSLPAEGSDQYVWSRTTFPAFLEIKGDKTTLIARDDFTAPVSFPMQNLQPRHLLLDRVTGTLITFDAATGELVRLKLLRN